MEEEQRVKVTDETSRARRLRVRYDGPYNPPVERALANALEFYGYDLWTCGTDAEGARYLRFRLVPELLLDSADA